jgi:hypothetical protein
MRAGTNERDEKGDSHNTDSGEGGGDRTVSHRSLEQENDLTKDPYYVQSYFLANKFVCRLWRTFLGEVDLASLLPASTLA